MNWCDSPVLVTADGPTYSNVPEDTDADRPVLVTADGPTYSNVPEDTDADRPVLVTADGPTYSNVPEDTGELSSDDEPLVNIAKASQQTGSCNSPEVVTVGDLFGSCISPETAIASDLTDPDWHEDTVQPSTSVSPGRVESEKI